MDYALTRKLGRGNTLASLITPEAISIAQAAIDSITVESLKWIGEDLLALKQIHQRLTAKYDNALAVRLGDVALKLSGRAGTFKYVNAAKIAYLLYLFCGSSVHVSTQIILAVIEKHINVLQITLSPAPTKITSQEITLITHELEQVAKKITTQVT